MRVINDYIYTCNDCGEQVLWGGDGEPDGWTCPEPDVDDSADYCPECSAKRGA